MAGHAQTLGYKQQDGVNELSERQKARCKCTFLLIETSDDDDCFQSFISNIYLSIRAGFLLFDGFDIVPAVAEKDSQEPQVRTCTADS